MTRIGIFGTSGLAREVGDIADALGLQPIYVARDADEAALWTGDEPVVLEADIAHYAELSYVIGIGNGAIRRRLAESFATLRFGNLIHPSASFGKGQRAAVEQGTGNIVGAGTRLSNAITVGNHVIFNPSVTVGHDVVIEDFVTICPAATISGNVHVETGAWIGAGAVINQGNPDRKLRIGAGAVIGSGAVVTRDCEPGAVYAGVPARRLR